MSITVEFTSTDQVRALALAATFPHDDSPDAKAAVELLWQAAGGRPEPAAGDSEGASLLPHSPAWQDGEPRGGAL